MSVTIRRIKVIGICSYFIKSKTMSPSNDNIVRWFKIPFLSSVMPYER